MAALQLDTLQELVQVEPPFATGIALVRAAVGGLQAAYLFASYVLLTRVERRSSRTWDAVVQALHNNVQARWFVAFTDALHALYLGFRKWARPTAARVHEPPIASELTRKQRRVLSKRLFSIAPTAKSKKRQAEENLNALWNSLRNSSIVLWVDNFNRFRYGTNPMRVNLSFDASVFAVMHVPLKPAFPGYPSLRDLVGGFRNCYEKLFRVFGKLQRECMHVLQRDLSRSTVRVPLDKHRKGVISLPWMPLLLDSMNAASSKGLVQILATCLKIAQHACGDVPVLMDVNPYWRIMKLLYSRSTIAYNVHNSLHRIPPLFGIWHVYKYATTVLYRRYLPILALIEHPRLIHDANAEQVRCKPKLRHMEVLIAALLVLAPLQLPTIQDRLDSFAHDKPPVLVALKTLLQDHIPALFIIGERVRECNWSARERATGYVAEQACQYGFLLLLALTFPKEDTMEYIRCMAVHLLSWTSWHTSLPGAAYSEEFGEAMLSRLAQLCCRFRNACTVDEVGDLFLCCVPDLTGQAKDLVASRIPKGYITRVSANMRLLINTVSMGGKVPFAGFDPKSFLITPKSEWDMQYKFPLSWNDLHNEEGLITDILVKSVHTLVNSSRNPTSDQEDLLKSTFGTLSDDALAERNHNLRNLPGMPTRYRRGRTRCGRAQPVIADDDNEETLPHVFVSEDEADDSYWRPDDDVPGRNPTPSDTDDSDIEDIYFYVQESDEEVDGSQGHQTD